MAFVITDDKDRNLIVVNDKGKVAISRYPDLTDKYKDYVANFYSDMTGEELNKVLLFLNYKEGKKSFCA